MSCRMGPLRGRRSLRDGYTRFAMVLPLVGMGPRGVTVGLVGVVGKFSIGGIKPGNLKVGE